MELNERAIISSTGKDGTAPAHEWAGTSLRFENPDKSWGAYTNLIGPAGSGSTILAHRTGERSEPINEIEVSQQTDATIDAGKLIVNAPNKTHDLSWNFNTLGDVPDARGRVGAVVYIVTLDAHYYSNGVTWNELKGTGGSGPGPTPTGETYYVGKYDSVDALRTAVPRPVLNKSFGFVTDNAKNTNLRYLYYVPKAGMAADWYVYRMTDAGGFRMDPNPPVKSVNYFDGATEDAAKQARDAYMADPNNAADFERYKNDAQLMVLLEWPDASAPDKRIAMYQNWLVDKWINTFENYTFTFNLGAHSIDELRDGSRVGTLERTVVTAIECLGAHTDIDLCEGLIENNTIRLSKIGTNTAKYLRMSKLPSQAVNVELVHTWHGIYNSIADANAAIDEGYRLHNETTIAIKEKDTAYTGYVQLYTWNAYTDNWEKLIPSGAIPADIMLEDNVTIVPFVGRKLIGGNNIKLRGTDNGDLTIHCAFAPVKFVDVDSTRRNVTELIPGNNVSMTMDWKGALTINATGGGAGGSISAKVGTQTSYTDITKISIEDKFATISSGILSVPAMKLFDAGGTAVTQLKGIKAGTNVVIDAGAGADEGIITINAAGGSGGTSVFGKLNDSAAKELTELVIIDNATGTNTFDDAGKLTVYVNQAAPTPIGLDVVGVNPDNVTVRYSDVTDVKFAGNTVLTQDPDTKQVTVTSIGLIGTLLGKSVSDVDADVWKPIHKLQVDGDKDLVSIEVDPDSSDPQLHQMTISLKGVITAQTIELLEQDHPAATNPNRLAHVTTGSQLFYSDGTAWHLYTSKYLPEYVRSIYTRFPQRCDGDGSYDENLNSMNGVSYVDVSGCPLPTASREAGILQNFVYTDKQAAQMFFGLTTGSIWHRHKDPASVSPQGTWLEWVQLKGAPALCDENFAILTPATFKVGELKEEIMAKKPLPWLNVQDATCNVIALANGTIQVKRPGRYKFTVCFHLSADPDTAKEATDVGSTFKFYLKDAASGTDIVAPKTLTAKAAPAGTGTHGLYPAVIATFDNVDITANKQVKVWLEVGRSAFLREIYIDSYKNFIAIEPADTTSNQGRVVALNLKSTLGGISYRQGFEVHVEGHDTIPESGDQVRVFGAHVNTNQPVEG